MAAIYREELPDMLDILDPTEEENNNLTPAEVIIQHNQQRLLHEHCNSSNNAGLLPQLSPHLTRSVPELHSTTPVLRRTLTGSLPELNRGFVNGSSNNISSPDFNRRRRSLNGPVPDLLRDWESITEEEIDNFIGEAE